MNTQGINPGCQTGDAETANLLQRAHEGDMDAFCALAQAHEQRLFQQAVSLCRNPATAEDLAAETLIEAWKSIARFDGGCRFSTWLYAILLHRYQKFIRRQSSRPVPFSALSSAVSGEGEQLMERLPDAGPSSLDALERMETDARLREAVDALPEIHREVLLLRYFEDASMPEIATALGLSLGTVKSRLHHALEKLRRMRAIENLLSS